MTTPLTDEEMRRYTQLVDAILATADLETVTRKKVRKGLEKALGGKDLSDQKVAIKDLIEARFDAINSQSQSPEAEGGPETNGTHNGHGHGHSRGDDDVIKVSLDTYSGARSRPYDDSDDAGGDAHAPAKKKHKRASSSIEDADARLAAELQAQENRLARSRTTRGGATSKPKPKPKAKPAKKKSSVKVRAEDDSDGGGGDGGDGSSPKEKKKASGGFQKPFNLSHQLAELVGVQQLSRPQVVKKLWEHIKANNLQDPTDKRQIRCDEKMQAVFKQHKIDMFQMNKLLSNHLYPVDEE